MKAVEKEFEKITKLRENNERSEESLLKEIEKVTVKKQKYMEMFQNEIINIQELKKYTNPLNEDIARLERELKLITSEIKEKDVLEKELNKTIKTVDDILNNQTITNAMLKTIIDVIEVDSDSNVEVRLKLLNEIGTNEPVITKFEDIYQNGEDTENKDANNNEKILQLRKVTSVHKDVSERLKKINPSLAREVRRILDENKAERHIRGGMATKLKYSHLK